MSEEDNPTSLDTVVSVSQEDFEQAFDNMRDYHFNELKRLMEYRNSLDSALSPGACMEVEFFYDTESCTYFFSATPLGGSKVQERINRFFGLRKGND